METDCVFCRIAAGDIPADKVYEDEDVLAFRDLHPIAPTHVLLIPKKHVATVNDLVSEHDLGLGRVIRAASEVARIDGLRDGYRLIVNCGPAAGQVVLHLHVHMIGGRVLGWPPG